MANVKISELPVATVPLAGSELVPVVQSGTTEQVTVANLTAGRTVTAGALAVDANAATAAVRITQTGAGNALVVEDSASPDATPFVIDANGTVVVGHTASLVTAYDVQSLTTDGASYVAQRYAANAGGVFMRMDKSRGATIGTNTVVNNGDSIGLLEFRGADGTNFIVSAQILAQIDGAPSVNDMPGRLLFSTTADGASTATERMRISSVGFTSLTGSFGRGAPVTKTGNFTLADTENWIVCNGAGTITVTFPAASSWAGREVMIKTIAAQTVVSASANVVPLTGGAAGTAILAAVAGRWATLVSDGTNWIVMAAA